MSDEKPRLTRRAVLAAIALAQAPPPQEITFNEGRIHNGKPLQDSIGIYFADDMHAFRQWCALLSAEDRWVRHQRYEHKVTRGEIWTAVIWDQWGWKVDLQGFEVAVASDELLPADTVQALKPVADEHEERPR